jgi:hypothetical protein
MATRNSEDRPVDLAGQLCAGNEPIDIRAGVTAPFFYGLGVEEMRAELEHKV